MRLGGDSELGAAALLKTVWWDFASDEPADALVLFLFYNLLFSRVPLVYTVHFIIV